MALAPSKSQRDFDRYVETTVGGLTALRVANADGSAISAGGGGGTSAIDDAAFTVAVSTVTPIGGIVTADSVDSGDVGALAMLANRQLKVTLYDSSAVELAVGGGTQYVEDAVAVANPTGNALILVREDARAGSLVSADGDNVAARGTNKGELYIKHTDSIPVTNVGTFATQDSEKVADNAGFTDGSTKVLPVGFIFDDVAGTALTENDAAAARINANRAQVHIIEDGATRGRYATVNASNQLSVIDANGADALTALQKIDDPVLVDDAAFTPATSSVSMAGFEADETATDSVDEGDAGAVRMTLDRKLISTPQPHTQGGLSIFRSIDLDEGALEVVKASTGQVYGMWVTNRATSTRWVKFYDAASGTAGTGTPVITWGIPGNSSDNVSAVFGSGYGLAFATGICVGAVTGVLDNDTGAPGTNDVIINVFYK